MNRIHMAAPILMMALLISTGAMAQNKDKATRPSPMMTTKAQLPNSEVMIQYSSPKVKGRTIWGELVPYGKVWRTGANEATTVTLTGDVKTEGGVLKAGKYALFTIPGEKEWEIIFNSVWDQWGAYNYSPDKDVVKFKAPARKTDNLQEDFTITVNESGMVQISWEYVTVSFELM